MKLVCICNKYSQQTKDERELPQLDKGYWAKESMANSIFNIERLKGLKIRKRQRCLLSPS